MKTLLTLIFTGLSYSYLKLKTMETKKAKKTNYVVVTFTTIDERTCACVNFTGTKYQCVKYLNASELLGAEVMSMTKYNNILPCLM